MKVTTLGIIFAVNVIMNELLFCKYIKELLRNYVEKKFQLC